MDEISLMNERDRASERLELITLRQQVDPCADGEQARRRCLEDIRWIDQQLAQAH